MTTKLHIDENLAIPLAEVSFSAIRAQGAGGQNVNKVSSAVHLRFDIAASSLPEELKAALLALKDRRVNSQGIIVIKAQQFRSQEKNRAEALERLRQLILKARTRKRARKATRPTLASRRRRLDQKNRRGATKDLRRKPVL